ncbi:unnamed protein product [Cyprideis torosa]|uniref:Uncharacterized protein n=1 Tax=Cyprideis torosa TaxID=163714 RepID=A0A7R8ZMV1_9CRUS|nr:unnamed protein product [Cyprideis torosa]CAG0889940.1 unnamed protein product [Cyprideis torosa]
MTSSWCRLLSRCFKCVLESSGALSFSAEDVERMFALSLKMAEEERSVAEAGVQVDLLPETSPRRKGKDVKSDLENDIGDVKLDALDSTEHLELLSEDPFEDVTPDALCATSLGKEGESSCEEEENEGSSSRSVTFEAVFQCSECFHGFKRRYDLKRHQLTHMSNEEREMAQNKYSCQEAACDAAFPKLILLRRHRRDYHPPSKESLTCSFCGLQLKSKFNLKSHLLIHTGTKSFLCEECGRAFLRRRPLQEHIAAMHSVKRQFPCPENECDKSYVRSVDLDNHLRSHRGEKPFVCEFCGNGYTYKCHLTEHRRTHTGEKPYVCNQNGCHKSFSRHSKLRRHHRVHSGEKPFTCSLCGNSYRQQWGLQYHQKEKHGGVLKVPPVISAASKRTELPKSEDQVMEIPVFKMNSVGSSMAELMDDPEAETSGYQ